MEQRGVSKEEIEKIVNEGYNVGDAKEGTIGKVLVFPYNAYWEGKYFEEKEVTVFFKYKDDEFVLLTTKVRYGKKFITGEKER